MASEKADTTKDSAYPAAAAEFADALDRTADDVWPFALAVSSMSDPERDNNFGRAAVLIRKAAATLRATANKPVTP